MAPDSWVKNDGSWVYVKLYAETMQGIQNFTNADATAISGLFISLWLDSDVLLIWFLSGSNPDFATQDLYQSIQNGTFPGWTMYAQVLSPQDAETFKYNVLDLTKYVMSLRDIGISPGTRANEMLSRDWGFDDVPRTEIGKFYLTQNPDR